MYDANECSDAKQRTRRHDHVSTVRTMLLISQNVPAEIFLIYSSHIFCICSPLPSIRVLWSIKDSKNVLWQYLTNSKNKVKPEIDLFHICLKYHWASKLENGPQVSFTGPHFPEGRFCSWALSQTVCYGDFPTLQTFHLYKSNSLVSSDCSWTVRVKCA